MKNKIDGIIFDLDGTLWNATKPISKIWTSVIQNYPQITREITIDDLTSVMGKTLEEIGEIFFPEQPKEMQIQLMDECCIKQCPILEKEGGVLYPDLEYTLGKLFQKYKLFIVSNCQNGYIPAFLKAHKLEKYFTDYECPGNTGLSKGENNKIIIERNNIKAAAYVGDTQGDADSAKFANIPFVYAKYGFGNVTEYDYKINSPKELIDIFF